MKHDLSDLDRKDEPIGWLAGRWPVKPLRTPTKQSCRLLPTAFFPAVFLVSLAACQQTALPAITSFEATPAEVTVGDPVTLAWRGSGAASCTLTTGQQSLTPENCDEDSVTERYTEAGTFTAELAYTAPDGSSLSKTAEVTVRADENSFTTEQNGLSVTFSAPANISENAPEEATFIWDFGDGQTASGVRVTHLYALPGNYLVTLKYPTGRAGNALEPNRKRHSKPGPDDPFFRRRFSSLGTRSGRRSKLASKRRLCRGQAGQKRRRQQFKNQRRIWRFSAAPRVLGAANASRHARAEPG